MANFQGGAQHSQVHCLKLQIQSEVIKQSTVQLEISRQDPIGLLLLSRPIPVDT